MCTLPIGMRLQQGFLDPETRSGYHVIARQKQIWAVELDLLKCFLEVCRKHDIRVHVFAGTLLGTVRHRGFIPWDDDVDVCMDRRNYKKLLQLPRDAFPEPYFLQTPLSDRKFYCHYARLRNSKTTGVIAWNNSPGYNNGIYIDIFVLDGYTRSAKMYLLQRKLDSLMKRIVTSPRRLSGCHSVKDVLGRIMRCILPYKCLVWMHGFVLGLATRWTDRLTFMTHPEKLLKKYWILKSDLMETLELPFENIMVPVPKDYAAVLTRIYGDYMSFPPVEERGQWHEGQIHFEPTVPYVDYFKRIGKLQP